MKITKKQIFSFFLCLCLVVVVFGIVYISSASASGSLWDSQAGMSDIGKAFGEKGEPTDIKVVVAKTINLFLGFVGIIMVVLFIWAGYKWMTSQGNEEVIREAKGQLQTAVIGLAIILMSYSIAAYITQCMYKIIDGSMATILCN